MTKQVLVWYYIKSVRTADSFHDGEMSERFKEPVLKTGDVQASVGSNPTLSATTSTTTEYCLQKYPRGRRGSPAKGVGCLKNAARVQIPPSAPARRKRLTACDEFFMGSIKNSSCVYPAAPHFQSASAALDFGLALREEIRAGAS